MKLLLWLRDHPWKTLGLCCVGGLFVLIYLFCFWDIDPVPTPPELEVRTPQVAPEKNAYTVLMKHEAWFEANKVPWDSEPIDPILADDAKMAATTSRLGEIRKEFLDCTQFTSPQIKSYHTLLPHLTPYRSLFRHSQLETLWHLKNDRTEKALESVSEMKQMLKIFREPQCLIESLVQISCTQYTLKSEAILYPRLNPHQIVRLRSIPWPTPVQLKNWWKNSLATEARIFAVTAEEIRSGKCREIDGVELPWYMRPMMKPQIFKELHQDWMLKLLPMVEIPFNETACRSLEREFTILRMTTTSKPTPKFGAQALVCMLVPAALNCHKKFIALETALRLHQSRCACLNYLEAHSQPPPDLATLVKDGLLQEIPIDPWDGKPLRYDGKRGILWSVGDNLTDEGGTPNGKFSVLLGEEVPDLAAMNYGEDIVLPLKLKTSKQP